MPSYRLTYFNSRGLAELTRLVFAEANVTFEDVRITRDDWPKLKPKTPLGHLPILEIESDGGKETIADSLAIARYVAKETGKYGKTTLDAAHIDSVIYAIRDLIPSLIKSIFGKSDDEKASAKKDFEEKLAATVVSLEKFLCANGGGDGWFVGKEISLADLQFYQFFESVLKMKGDALAEAPKLQALSGRVAQQPRIKAWIAKRPETDH